jgi:hypothetical protein
MNEEIKPPMVMLTDEEIRAAVVEGAGLTFVALDLDVAAAAIRAFATKNGALLAPAAIRAQK